MADASLGFFGGLASGIDSGARLGLAARAQNTSEQELQFKMQQDADRTKQEQIKNQLSAYQQLTTLYKDTHKSLRPKLWPTIAKRTNELFGTQFDPNIVPPSSNEAVEGANHEIQNYLDGKQSLNDTFTKLGMFATTLDEETRNAVKTGADLLEKSPAAKKESSSGGSYNFAGYDNNQQPIFSFSKAPMLVDSTGKTFNGPLLQKADPMKIQTEVNTINSQLASVGDMKSLLLALPGGIKGAAESAVSELPGGGVLFKKAKEYNDTKPALATAFYRSATGDTRLSDADAKARALPLFPDLSDPIDLRQAKLDRMELMLNRRKEAAQKGITEVSWDANTGGGAGSISAPKAKGISKAGQAVISKWTNPGNP